MINESGITIFLFGWGRGELKPQIRLYIIFFISYHYKSLYFEFEKNPLIDKSDITIFLFRVGERGPEASNEIVYNIFYFLSLQKLTF